MERPRCRFSVLGFGVRVSRFGFRAGIWFRVSGSGLSVWGWSEKRSWIFSLLYMSCSWPNPNEASQGLGLGVQGLGFRGSRFVDSMHRASGWIYGKKCDIQAHCCFLFWSRRLFPVFRVWGLGFRLRV